MFFSFPMETPPFLEQPPAPSLPALEMTVEGYTTDSDNGSYGPVIAVLAVIVVLCIGSNMVGRLCSGRQIMGRGGNFDIELVETQCSSGVDGGIARTPPPPPPPPAAEPGDGDGDDVIIPVEAIHEIIEEDDEIIEEDDDEEDDDEEEEEVEEHHEQQQPPPKQNLPATVVN